MSNEMPTDKPLEKKDEEIKMTEEDVVGKIEFPEHWEDDQGVIHGARNKKEMQEQIDAYRESQKEK